jgi:hypothetical protein
MVFCLCKTDLKIVSGSLAYRDSQYNIPQEIKHQVPSKKGLFQLQLAVPLLPTSSNNSGHLYSRRIS